MFKTLLSQWISEHFSDQVIKHKGKCRDVSNTGLHLCKCEHLKKKFPEVSSKVPEAKRENHNLGYLVSFFMGVIPIRGTMG